MFQANPSLIQKAPLKHSKSLPLFLIHDGGGTTFAYSCLGPLNRTVYGIHNPRFFSGRAWNGGIAEMAKVYANLIRSVVSAGPILLGGWSLGGLLSLEMSKILANSDVEVAGILMVDSVYPGSLQSPGREVVSLQPTWTEHCRSETRLLVSRCMQKSSGMLESWSMPSWSRRSSTSSLASSLNFSLESEIEEPSSTRSSPDSTRSVDSVGACPSVVLLRCNEYVPVVQSEAPGAISRVDVARESPLLGWEEYGYDMIEEVVEVPGHHFNVFSEKHIYITTQKIQMACKTLEHLYPRSRAAEVYY